MKNIFGRNITDKKIDDDIAIDGRGFITAEIDNYLLEEYKRIREILSKDLNFYKKLKLVGSFAGWIALCLGLYLMADIWDFVSLTMSSLYFLCFLFFLILWIVLLIAIPVMIKKYVETQNYQEKSKKLDEIGNQIKEQLGIPEDAAVIDILAYNYKLKKEKEVLQGLGYLNMSCFLFQKENDLCIADHQMRISLPLEQITEISEIKKRIPFLNWNKEKSYTDKEYKKYKITCGNGIYYIKPCYALRIEDIGEKYELFIMPYDLKTLLNLLPEKYRRVE